jgi:membrane protein YqaA with SNARE-associated domain
MNNLLSLISHHGYLLLALVCFAEALGLPLPAALAILTAGAAAAYGGLHFYLVFGIAVLSLVCGDVLLYFMGRVSGWALLGLLCRLSANPETCILRSAEYFYRRGKQTLLFAKFIPGINTMSPPLAGSMKMRLQRFSPIRCPRSQFLRRRLLHCGISLQWRASCHHPRTAFRRLCRRGHLRHRTPRATSSIASGSTANTACSTSSLASPPKNSPEDWPPRRPPTCSSPMSAVTATTMPNPNALPGPFASNPTT